MSRKFGTNNDGWNQEDLEGVIDTLNDLQFVNYELNNCRRTMTVPELAAKLEKLAEALKDEAEFLIRYSEKEFEEEED